MITAIKIITIKINGRTLAMSARQTTDTRLKMTTKTTMMLTDQALKQQQRFHHSKANVTYDQR